MAGFADLIQKIFATVERIDSLAGELDRERGERRSYEEKILERLQSLHQEVADLRERVVRLEAQREADRKTLAAEFRQLLTKVERNLPKPPLPPGS